MVHRLEDILVHLLHIIRLHRIDLQQRDLVSAFCVTEFLSSLGSIDHRRTDQLQHLRTIRRKELFTHYLIIYIIPEVQCNVRYCIRHTKADRHNIVTRISRVIVQTINKLNVVRLGKVLQKPLIKHTCTHVCLLYRIHINRIRELIVLTGRHS